MNSRTLPYLILMLCVGLWSMAPVFSYMYQAKSGTTWIEICTIDGIARVPVADQDSPAPAHTPEKKTSCPFCSIAATSGHATIPSQAVNFAAPQRIAKNNEKPLYGFLPSRSFRSGLSAPLRAPPSFS